MLVGFLSWRRLLVVVAVLAVALAGCGNSADPNTWGEAEEGDYEGGDSAVEVNFMDSCRLANQASTGGDLSEGDALVLCRCTFRRLRESMTLQQFKTLDEALRETPNPSDLDEAPEDLWDDLAEGIIEGCARGVDA